MDQLIAFLDAVPVAKKTIKNYKCALKKLTEGYDGDSFDAFNDLDHIKAILATYNTEASKKTFLTNIDTINKKYADVRKLINDDIYDDFKSILTKTREVVKEIVEKQVYEFKYFIEDLVEMMEEHAEDSLEHLFVATSVLIPPRRRDWSHAVFVKKLPDEIDSTKNYVIINDDNTVILSFNKSKTSESCGNYTKLLDNTDYTYLKYLPHLNPSKLSKLLINSYNKNPRTNVFMENDEQWKTFTRNIYRNYPDMNQNVFRHAYAQEVFVENKINEYYLKQIVYDTGNLCVDALRRYSNPEVVKPQRITQPSEVNEVNEVSEVSEVKPIDLRNLIPDLGFLSRATSKDYITVDETDDEHEEDQNDKMLHADCRLEEIDMEIESLQKEKYDIEIFKRLYSKF